MKKVALITGITGQDGSYLAELLLSKNYEVHGLIRRSSSLGRDRLSRIADDPHKSSARTILHYGDLQDGSSINRIIAGIKPTEIYHLGAQSHVGISYEIPEYTGEVTGLGALRLLEAVRSSGLKTRFYQASSSEMFGSAPPLQSETTPFQPRSPYACAKVYAYWISVNYREAFHLFVCNGILFNHESPRRGENFVTRKISRGVARIKKGLDSKIYLGNLKARRDWGYAPEYVEAMWLMMQKDQPEDYVIATGECHTVGEFVEEAFSFAGLDWRKHVKLDSRYLRPSEVDFLQGNASKARKKLGWAPKVKFQELVRLMVDADLKALSSPRPNGTLPSSVSNHSTTRVAHAYKA
jgi:GDPmannose 4,6-dehydratase